MGLFPVPCRLGGRRLKLWLQAVARSDRGDVRRVPSPVPYGTFDAGEHVGGVVFHRSHRGLDQRRGDKCRGGGLQFLQRGAVVADHGGLGQRGNGLRANGGGVVEHRGIAAARGIVQGRGRQGWWRNSDRVR